MERVFAGGVVLLLVLLAFAAFWLPGLLPIAALAFIGRAFLTVAALALLGLLVLAAMARGMKS